MTTETPRGDDRAALAAAIYQDGDRPEWLTTIDRTPNAASYEYADRVIRAGFTRAPQDDRTAQADWAAQAGEVVTSALKKHRVNYHHHNVNPEPVTAANLRYTSCDGCDWLGGHRDEAGWEAHVGQAAAHALAASPVAQGEWG